MKEKNKYYKGKKFLKEKFIRDINRRNPKIKIKIVAEKGGKKIELPVSKYTIFELSDFGYYDGDNFERIRDDLSQFWKDVEILEHDIINNGRTHGYNKRTKRFDKKLRHYLYKKPEWRKIK